MASTTPQSEDHREVPARRLSRFRISTLFMAVAQCALGIGWWTDRSNLQGQLDEHNLRAVMDALAMAEAFKQHQWRPSNHLSTDTETVEGMLNLKTPTGSFKSSTGWGETYQLRKPSPRTFRQVIALLADDDDDDTLRHRAAIALALYGEAFYSAPLFGTDRANCDLMRKEAVPKLLPLVSDSNPSIRASAALALGQIASREDAAPTLVRAFKRENDSTARLCISWAIQRMF